MAENILFDSSESEEEHLYSLPDIRDVDTEISEELNVRLEELSVKDSGRKDTETSEELNVEFKELSVKESGRKGAKCESCVREGCPWSEWSESFEIGWRENYERERSERSERARELYGKVAVFFCFLCEMFVCAECLPKHKTHEGIKVERKESEGKGFMARIKKRWQKAERERNERKSMRREFVLGLASESERTRKGKIFSSHRNVCDRVDVKHELDQTDCEITGLCGLENKRLVVCDSRNSCIKIFKLGSHVLQRYIRFVGSDSEPWDVTEIDLKQNSTEPNLVSGSSSDISVTDRADPDKQCLIAVTLPRKRQIMFKDLSKKPAKAQKTIKTEEECHSIQFYDDKIFTVCSEGRDSPRYVYIYSTDGDTLNKFDIGIYRYFPRLAVVSGRVYITYWLNNKVECRNVEGQLISEITIKRSGPVGISVDPDNNVYVCAQWHNKVYKLDADLTRYKSVLDQTTDYIEYPHALCYYRDKLFISHFDWPPSLRNFVTVVRLL